jgi:uncharacterized membrane protein
MAVLDTDGNLLETGTFDSEFNALGDIAHPTTFSATAQDGKGNLLVGGMVNAPFLNLSDSVSIHRGAYRDFWIGKYAWSATTTTPPVATYHPQILNVSVYPNPTNGELHISGENQQLQYILYDLQGKLITEGTALSNKISLQGTPQGAYMLHLTNPRTNETAVQKVIIKFKD